MAGALARQVDGQTMLVELSAGEVFGDRLVRAGLAG
jgi:hypothetical protein